MRSLLTIAIGCLFFVAQPARAQEPAPLSSTPVVLPPASASVAADLTSDQEQELAAWVDDMSHWLKQEKKSPNGPMHNNYGKIVPRRPEPPAPDWLASYCISVNGVSSTTAPKRVRQGCKMLAGLSVDPEAESIRQQTLAQRADKEKVVKNSFFSRVHIDGLWTTTSSDI